MSMDPGVNHKSRLARRGRYLVTEKAWKCRTSVIVQLGRVRNTTRPRLIPTIPPSNFGAFSRSPLTESSGAICQSHLSSDHARTSISTPDCMHQPWSSSNPMGEAAGARHLVTPAGVPIFLRRSITTNIDDTIASNMNASNGPLKP
jgi:hypothetical protein